MENHHNPHPSLTQLIRWAARILSVVNIVFIILFVIGEGFNYTLITQTELTLFIFFPVGISIGMILAWWQEGIGGSITVGSLVMFYIIHFANRGQFPNGWWFLVFTIPGFLFLICRYRTPKIEHVTD